MDYKIRYFEVVQELVEAVKKDIDAGWRPVGGVATGLYSDSTIYLFQAMQK